MLTSNIVQNIINIKFLVINIMQVKLVSGPQFFVCWGGGGSFNKFMPDLSVHLREVSGVCLKQQLQKNMKVAAK